jgi:hypothetical protein
LFQELVVILLLDTVFVNRLVEFGAKRTLHFGGYHLEAVRVKQVAEITFLGRGVLNGEEAVVETHLGVECGVTFHPVDGSFGLAVSSFCA